MSCADADCTIGIGTDRVVNLGKLPATFYGNKALEFCT